MSVQPSGVRLMMFFTFAGDLVTELGCIRHCTIKLYFVKPFAAAAAAADVIVNVIFNDYYRCTQNPSSVQCL